MKTTQLANGFATRIEDIDLSKPLDDDSFKTIRDLWMENRVVVFPEQQLDDDQLVAFTERFGPLFIHAQASLLTTYKRKEVMDMFILLNFAVKKKQLPKWKSCLM